MRHNCSAQWIAGRGTQSYWSFCATGNGSILHKLVAVEMRMLLWWNDTIAPLHAAKTNLVKWSPFPQCLSIIFAVKKRMRLSKNTRSACLQERNKGSGYTALSRLTGKHLAGQWTEPTSRRVISSSPNHRLFCDPGCFGLEWFSSFTESHQTCETSWPGWDIISSVKTETVM